MSQAKSQIEDSRTKSITPGMVVRDTRDPSREILIDYIDEDAGVICIDTDGDSRHDRVYGWEPYQTFMKNVESGRYTIVTADGSPVRRGTIGQIFSLRDQYADASGRTSEHKRDAIEEVLDILVRDETPDDTTETVPLTDIDGIGSGAASALHEHGFVSYGDIRSASKSSLTDVPYMGETNTQRLLDYVGTGDHDG